MATSGSVLLAVTREIEGCFVAVTQCVLYTSEVLWRFNECALEGSAQRGRNQSGTKSAFPPAGVL